MRETLTNLSYRNGKDFWQQFRHVLQMRECAIGPLQGSDGRLANSKEEISEELRKTFFLGQHLKGRSFDEDHYVEVTRRVRNQDPQWRNLTSSAFKVFNEDGERVNLGRTVGDLKLVDVCRELADV